MDSDSSCTLLVVGIMGAVNGKAFMSSLEFHPYVDHLKKKSAVQDAIEMISRLTGMFGAVRLYVGFLWLLYGRCDDGKHDKPGGCGLKEYSVSADKLNFPCSKSEGVTGY